MTIADRIRQEREKLNLSQEELARACGYADKTSISKIENAGDDITLKKIRRIANALGVTHSYLLGWETEEGDRTTAGEIADVYTYRAILDALPDEEREKTLEIEKQLVKLTPENRTLILNLLKSLLPDA